VLLLWIAMACSGGPTVAGTPPPDIAACAPWSGWALPDEGPELRIVACDERRLALRAPAGSAARVAPAWREALQAGGWVEDLENAAEGPPAMVAVRYRGEGDDVLQLSILDDVEHTQIVLVRPTPAAEGGCVASEGGNPVPQAAGTQSGCADRPDG
jgi:hypothetical protein